MYMYIYIYVISLIIHHNLQLPDTSISSIYIYILSVYFASLSLVGFRFKHHRQVIVWCAVSTPPGEHTSQLNSSSYVLGWNQTQTYVSLTSLDVCWFFAVVGG